MFRLHLHIRWLLLFLLSACFVAGQSNKDSFKLIKTITGKLSPKSVTNNGKNMFFAQNMMYNHSVAVYDSSFHLVSTISDNVTPSNYGLKDVNGSLSGGPVESVATGDGKYLWVSNYNMSGDGYTNPGCDTCCCKGYDGSMVYKINTQTFKVENVVKVGSVPKYLTISPDQKKLIVSNWSSGDVSIIDLATEKEVKRIFVGPAPRGITCDSNSANAYVAVMGCNKIVRLNLNTYQAQTLATGISNPRHLCILNKYLYASLNGEQAVCRIDLLTGKKEKLLVGNAPRSMALSSIYNKLFVDCYNDSKIAVVDLVNFKVETEFKTNGYPIGICLNNENNQIWVSCYSGCIQVFANGEPLKKKDSVPAIAQQKQQERIYPGALTNISLYPVSAAKPVVIKKAEGQKKDSTCYIVLGSFVNRNNALTLKKKLSTKGVQAELLNSKKGYTYCAYKTNGDKQKSEKLKEDLEARTGIKGWLYEI